jgi:hypothetical protein
MAFMKAVAAAEASKIFRAMARSDHVCDSSPAVFLNANRQRGAYNERIVTSRS